MKRISTHNLDSISVLKKEEIINTRNNIISITGYWELKNGNNSKKSKQRRGNN